MFFKNFNSSDFKKMVLPVALTAVFVFGAKTVVGIDGNKVCATAPEANVSSASTEVVSNVKPYELEDVYVEDDTIYEGEQVVVVEPVDGLIRETMEVTYEDGEVVKINVTDTNVIKDAVAKEIHVGTKERPNFILPVKEYNFSSPFGWRDIGFHTGIDLCCPIGTPVAVAADGVVTYSDWMTGYGYVVFVEHEDGISTRYAHLNELNATVGQTVSQGDIIGFSGDTGRTTCPHVHMEFRINGEAVDPVGNGFVNP